MPLFFWLLDTTVINSFLIAEQYIEHQHTRTSEWHMHSKFRDHLAWDFVEQGLRLLNPTRVQDLQSLPFSNIPSPNSRNCPGATLKENNPHCSSKGYIVKASTLSQMRGDLVCHNLIRNPTSKPPQYCLLCHFFSNSQAAITNGGQMRNSEGLTPPEPQTARPIRPQKHIRRTLFVTLKFCGKVGWSF